MSIYRMSDGTVVNTERAAQSFKEARDFDGHNQIGRYSGSQWTWAVLYATRKGRYYVETDGYGKSSAEFVSNEEATRFLSLAECPEASFPADLKPLLAEIEE